MTHDKFREQFESIGFDVSTDYVPTEKEAEEWGDDRPTLVAENDNGDKVYWNVDADTDTWRVYFDLDGATLDSPHYDLHDLRFERNAVVIQRATGTHAKSFGYGVAGFEGSVELGKHSATINEQTRI